MNARIPNIERIDSGPDYLDRTGDYVELLQKAEQSLIDTLKDALYKNGSMVRIGAVSKPLAVVLNDATDYPEGPAETEIMDVMLRIARKGDVDAQELIGRLIAVYAKYHAEVE
jgi:hypothetical protein